MNETKCEMLFHSLYCYQMTFVCAKCLNILSCSYHPCLVACSGVRYMLCCVFVLFFLLLCDLCCQFLWSIHFCIVPSVFSNVFAIVLCTTKEIVVV